MPFIKPPDLEKVEDSTKEIYEKVKEYTGSDSVSEVIRVLSLRPDLLNMTLSMVGTLLTAETELDNEIKEAIAILTSLENGCKICVGEHARIAKELGMKEEIVDKLAKGIEFIEFPEKEKKLLKFCVKSAKNAYKVLQEDIDTLIEAGYSGSQILEALCIVGYFNYMNTIMLATGSTS